MPFTWSQTLQGAPFTLQVRAARPAPPAGGQRNRRVGGHVMMREGALHAWAETRFFAWLGAHSA
jgi:hypothetical protein